MLEQRQAQTTAALIVLVVAVAAIVFMLIRLNATPMTPAASDQALSMSEIESSFILDQNLSSPEFLKLNHRTSGLTPNWRAYTASLNWADYPSSIVPPVMPVDAQHMNRPF